MVDEKKPGLASKVVHIIVSAVLVILGILVILFYFGDSIRGAAHPPKKIEIRR